MKRTLLLTGLVAALLFLTLPKGMVYGSNMDWLSQHAALAETIRDACRAQQTLLPQVLPLGGGANGFEFSYYGFLRPDILIGCLLPGVPMYRILIVYMCVGYLASVLLFDFFLRRELKNDAASFFGSVLFLCAACFFHTHRQVMFINYMPFFLSALLTLQSGCAPLTLQSGRALLTLQSGCAPLTLQSGRALLTLQSGCAPLTLQSGRALLTEQHRRVGLAAVFLALAYCNSFYYAAAMLAAVGWYSYRREGKKFWRGYLVTAAGSVGLAAVLLLPSLLVILEHKRETAAALSVPLFLPKLGFLLYSPYGMGLTLLVLYLLLAGLWRKEYRTDSLFYLLLVSCGFGAWLLNGTLYARGKILAPFVPLFLLHGMRVFLGMWRGEMKWQVYPFIPMTICFLLRMRSGNILGMSLDFLLVAVFVAVMRAESKTTSSTHARGTFRSRKAAVFACLLLLPAPFVSFAAASFGEDYVSGERLAQIEEAEKGSIAKTLGALVCEQPLYRFDSLYEPLARANRIGEAVSGMGKSAMYSSVTNQAYSDFYYDLMQTPVQINNRIAVLPEENPFLLSFLGVRYLETTREKLPEGYEVIATEGARFLAENPSVLPVAYAVAEGETLPEKTFYELDESRRIAALMRKTIIEDQGCKNIGNGTASDGQGQMQGAVSEIVPEFSGYEKDDALSLYKNEDGSLTVKATERAALTLFLKEEIKDEILGIQFTVESDGAHAVVITINGRKNKLSAGGAPYPNENHCFHYQLSGDENGSLKRIEILFSEGEYTLSDIKCTAYQKSLLTQKRYIPAVGEETKGNELLSCRVSAEADGYFVTSIPRQRGMKLYIDGKKTELLTVNTAFAGARLPAGEHQIRLCLTPPGLYAGCAISLLSVIALLAIRKLI